MIRHLMPCLTVAGILLMAGIVVDSLRCRRQEGSGAVVRLAALAAPAPCLPGLGGTGRLVCRPAVRLARSLGAPHAPRRSGPAAGLTLHRSGLAGDTAAGPPFVYGWLVLLLIQLHL